MTYEHRRRQEQTQDQDLTNAMNQLGVSLEKGPEWTIVLGLLRGGWPGTPTKADEMAYLTFLSDLDPGDVARALRTLAQQGQKYRPTPAEVRPHVQTTRRLELTPHVQAAWDTLKAWLATRLHLNAYRLWIEPIQAAGAAAHVLYLTAHQSIRTWSERRYLPLLRDHLPHLTDEYQDVQFIHNAQGQVVGAYSPGKLDPAPPTK